MNWRITFTFMGPSAPESQTWPMPTPPTTGARFRFSPRSIGRPPDPDDELPYDDDDDNGEDWVVEEVIYYMQIRGCEATAFMVRPGMNAAGQLVGR